jgi:hypothetical protein
VARHRAGQPRSCWLISAEKGILLVYKVFRKAPGPTYPPTRYVGGGGDISPGVKRPGNEADQTPFSGEVKHEGTLLLFPYILSRRAQGQSYLHSGDCIHNTQLMLLSCSFFECNDMQCRTTCVFVYIYIRNSKSPVLRVVGVSFSGVKWPGNGALHSTQCGVGIKNECRYTSTAPACLHVEQS